MSDLAGSGPPPEGAPASDGAADPVDADGDAASSALSRALDLVFFAPVGLAVTAAEDLPALIGKGRQRFETDIRNARVIGEFVVTQGQRQLMARVGKLIQRAPAPAGGESQDTAPPTVSPTERDPASPRGVPSTPAPTPATSAKPLADPADGIIVDEALAGYDTLSASQVVRRLESLQIEQLRAVDRHEASHRNRRTILNRAHQLLDAANASASASTNPTADHANSNANGTGPGGAIGGTSGAGAAEPDPADE